MKQKYIVLNNENDENQLIIREMAELDKEEYTLTCEEKYNKDEIAALVNQDRALLIAALQTPSLYPPKLYMGKIAEQIVEFFNSGAQEQVEVLLDDMDFIVKNTDYEEDDNVKIDELIDDTIEEADTFSEDDEIQTISENGPTSLKVADDDAIDIDDEAV